MPAHLGARRPDAAIYRTTVDGVREQCCRGCAQWKPATLEFWHPDIHQKSGLRANCRPCRSAQAAAAYQASRKRPRGVQAPGFAVRIVTGRCVPLASVPPRLGVAAMLAQLDAGKGAGRVRI